MRSMIAPEIDGERATAPPGFRSREIRLIDFRSRLPEQLASFLGHLSPAERRDVYAVQGTFLEVRTLVGIARLLDTFLREAPLAAARGRTTFCEFLEEKDDILGDIHALREKVNRSAANVCLMLPRVPQLRTMEDSREDAHALRVS